MRIKDIIMTGVCIFSFLAVKADDMKKCLVLLKNDDSAVYFPLEEEPKITFHVGDNWRIYEHMTIESNNEQLTVWLPEQNKLETCEVSGVALITDEGNSKINIEGKKIIMEASKDKVPYSIANVNGEVIMSGNLPIGLSVISLSDYQAGIYIITVGGKSLKISIR